MLLEKIKNPYDIKKLNKDEIDELCSEIRDTIIKTVSVNGGHLSSNLGIIEATVAIHRQFDAPKDTIIFDVGHQCYAHKLLTGRYDRFDTLRKKGGISGFTNKDESEYDTFFSGHSGSSVSQAIGIAEAKRKKGDHSYTVAVVGDGSMTNGMIFEALNNCVEKDLRLVIIINENEMSISGNVGGLSSYMRHVSSSASYFRFKHNTKKIFQKIPVLGAAVIWLFRIIKNMFRRILVRPNFFECLGLEYIGPMEGNNVKSVETALSEAKDKKKPCIVHIRTIKGYGYPPAEEHPDVFHSARPFDIKTGEMSEKARTFTDAFSDIIVKEAEKDDKICAITAAMETGTGLSEFKERFGDRFYDVGIAEEHAVTFGAGLSEEGYKPVCCIYSTFAQRVYDQLIQDVSLQRLNMTLLMDRSGLVEGDGPTHQGIYDIEILSTIPNITIYSPETEEELGYIFHDVVSHDGLDIIRIPKERITSDDRSYADFETEGEEDPDVTIVTFGRIVTNVRKAVKILGPDVKVKIVKAVKLYPFSKGIIDAIGEPDLVYVIEECRDPAIFNEEIIRKFSDKIVIKDIKEDFIPHGTINELMELCGFMPEEISEDIKAEILRKKDENNGGKSIR